MDVRDRVLDLNSPARPWQIRDGSPEGVDLVAEWKSDDPDWRQVLEDLSVALTFQIHLRVDHEHRCLWGTDHVIEWGRDPEDPRAWMEFRDQGDLQLSWSGNSNCQHHAISTEDIKISIAQCVSGIGWTYAATGG